MVKRAVALSVCLAAVLLTSVARREARADGGKWGFIDRAGEVVIDPRFQAADAFHEGLAAVKVGDKWGYIDKTGKVVIEPGFDDAIGFSQYVVSVSGRELGEGLARVAIGDMCEEGLVIEPAPGVRLYDEDGRELSRVTSYDTLYHKRAQKWGFIDKTGKMVVEPQLSHRLFTDSEGLTQVELSGGKWGYIKPGSGTTHYLVISRLFDDAGNFGEGLAPVCRGCIGRMWSFRGKWGYIDRMGKVVIEVEFDDAGNFGEGLAPVKVGDKWGYIDKTGELVIEPGFDDAYRFGDGLAPVKVGDKCGYIDKTGRMVIEPQFDKPWGFRDGLVAVKVGDKWGYIDKTGRMVAEPQFDQAGMFSEGLAAVKVGRD